MSREGLRIAARDRARRLEAALGPGVTVLMGCPLVVLGGAPPTMVDAAPAPAANASLAAAPAACGTDGALLRPPVR